MLLAGCIESQETNSKNWNKTELQMQNCRLVEQEVPYTERVCKNLTENREECKTIELSYKVSNVEEYDICMTGDGCAGKNLSQCLMVCTRANKRCVIQITNTDKVKGRWSAGATFIQGNAVFIKNPQIQEIMPGETKKFDFIHIYDISVGRVTTTICTIQLIYPATAEDCKTITEQVEICENITKTKIEEKEICD